MLKNLTAEKHRLTLALLSLGMFFLIWIAGCSAKDVEPPDDTPTPAPTPYGITYCDIAPGDLCLEGFGMDGEDNMLILLKADDRAYASIHALMEQKEGEFYLECLQSQTVPENVYCEGDVVPDGEKIELFFYATSDGTMLAKGAFIVHYGSIEQPDVQFGSTSTATETGLTPAGTLSPTPGSAYPNPSPTRSPSPTTAPAYPN